jgi:hypothetical protein
MPAMLYIAVRRLFGKYDVYYLDMHNTYRDVQKIKDLEKRGIKWVKREYKHFSQYLSGMFDAVSYSERIYEKIRLSHLNKAISDALLENDSQRNKMDVFWKYYIYRMIWPFAEQYAAARYLAGTGRYERVTVIAFNSLASFLTESFDEGAIKVRILPGLDFYKGYTRILKEYGRSFFKRGIGFFRSRKPEQCTAPEDCYEKSPHLKNIEDYEVIYFPHQGIFYSDLFTKDHFYSDDVNSPLHRSKILHISLGEKNEQYMAENYKFYKENNIPYIDLYEIGYDKKVPKKKVIDLLLRLKTKFFSDIMRCSFWYIMYALYLYFTVERYRSVFSRFKNLKVALIGYDHLFQRYLSIALTTTGTKVCATQERLIFAFWPDNYYIFDYYFVAGRAAKEEGLKTSYIDHCVPVGMMREDKLYEYEKLQIYDEKYDRIKENKKLILALDYHMPDNEIEDATRQAAKIHQTREFYKDLIRLSKEFPSLHIAIKGKISDLYKSHFIEDFVKEINDLDNMEIELDLKKYNPYFITEKADLTIACHTSLADELLAAGRKVIFYETTDLMETLLVYDNLPIIVKDYEGLAYHIKRFLNGRYIDEEKIKTLQEKYYSNCYHGKARKIVQEMLEKIIMDGRLGKNDIEPVLKDPKAWMADVV